MKITDKNKLNETELTLAIPEELLEKAKEVAEATKEDEMFPFTLRYDASRTVDLKIMLQAADVHLEKEAENSVTAYMNMAQLQLLKGLEFVEQVIAEDTGHRKELIDFICQEGPVPAASRTETEAETIRPVNHVDANSEGAVAEAAAGDHAVAAVQSSCCGCPTNKDMESAQMISAGSYVSGCICCPGAEQWFKFTVPVSKTYTIYTSGALDTIGTLLDCCGNVLATNDDYAGKLNFRMIQNLTAGTTYYVRVRAFGNTTGSYTFRVTDSIFASGVSISQTSITLEKDVLYELPITPNYTYKGYLGAKRIPGLSVSVIPANADEQKVWWWEHYDGVLDCSYGWDDDGDRYIHVTAKKLGTSKLYARDWNENGRRGECTVTVLSPYQNQLLTLFDFSLEESNLILKCYSRIDSVFASDTALQKAWRCARLLSEFSYDNLMTIEGVEIPVNRWDLTAGSVAEIGQGKAYFMNTLGYTENEYDKLSNGLQNNKDKTEKNKNISDFTHMQYALAARLAYILDKAHDLTHWGPILYTSNFHKYTGEEVSYLGGWFGDAILARYYAQGANSLKNDDYMADLDAENVYRLIFQGYSYLDALDAYYSTMNASNTRATIFLQYIPYATVKEKIFYELIDAKLIELMANAANQGDVFMTKYYLDLINNEQYHFDVIKSRYPDTYDFLKSLNDHLLNIAHYE